MWLCISVYQQLQLSSRFSGSLGLRYGVPVSLKSLNWLTGDHQTHWAAAFNVWLTVTQETSRDTCASMSHWAKDGAASVFLTFAYCFAAALRTRPMPSHTTYISSHHRGMYTHFLQVERISNSTGQKLKALYLSLSGFCYLILDLGGKRCSERPLSLLEDKAFSLTTQTSKREGFPSQNHRSHQTTLQL